MTVSAFQIKFVIKRPGMKPVTISGVVLAYTRQEAVFEATKTIRETTDAMEKETSFKLLSAITIPNDFFIMCDNVINKAVPQTENKQQL